MPILVRMKGVAEDCAVSSFGLVLLLQSFDMSSDLGSCPHFSLLFYKLHCRSLVTARRNPKRFAKWFGSCSGSGCEKQHDHWAPTFDESVYCCHATESDSLSCAGDELEIISCGADLGPSEDDLETQSGLEFIGSVESLDAAVCGDHQTARKNDASAPHFGVCY